MSNSNIIDNIIKSSLEYYDTYQPKVIDILNDIYYIKIIDNGNITNEIIFYNKNKIEIFKSSYEILSAYIPQQKVWKWAWSLAVSEKKSNFVSRKILDYAFNLDYKKDFFLKSTLINSNITIINDLQLDIYTALSANISKKPFIFKLYYPPIILYKTDDEFYPYRKIIEDPEKDNYMVYYLFILDFDK